MTSWPNKIKLFLDELDWKLILLPVIFVVSGYCSYLVLETYTHPTAHPHFILLIVLASVAIALILTSLVFTIFMICLITLFAPVNSRRFNKYLKTVAQDPAAKVAIVLGYPNWLKFKGWYKINFTKYEIELIFKYLKMRGETFRIYQRATPEDVMLIMSDPTIQEIFFCGHGDSHVFCLSSDKTIFYCDFKGDLKYKKEFVHQVHCGTKNDADKRLIDYVVPEENRGQCFYFPKSITSRDIRKEFERRIEKLATLQSQK